MLRRSFLLLLGSVLLPPAAAAQGTTTVILNESWAAPDQATVDATIQRIADAGYKYVLDYAKGRVSTQCQYDIESWGAYGRYAAACSANITSEHLRIRSAPFTWWVQAARRRRLNMITRVDFPFFDGAMPARGTFGWENKRIQYAWLYADFAATLAAEYPDIKVVQVGNEPDRWGGETGFFSAQEFVSMTALVARAVHNANPRAEVWGGVVSDLGDFYPNTYSGSSCPVSPDAAVGMGQAMLTAGIANWIDRFAVHDYHAAAGGPQAGCATWQWSSGDEQWAAVDAKLAAAGLPPFVITEGGFALSWLPGTTPERLQAQADREVFETQRALAAGRMRVNYTFVLSFSDPTLGQEQTFGLVGSVVPWSPRPAYDAIRALLVP